MPVVEKLQNRDKSSKAKSFRKYGRYSDIITESVFADFGESWNCADGYSQRRSKRVVLSTHLNGTTLVGVNIAHDKNHPLNIRFLWLRVLYALAHRAVLVSPLLRQGPYRARETRQCCRHPWQRPSSLHRRRHQQQQSHQQCLQLHRMV